MKYYIINEIIPFIGSDGYEHGYYTRTIGIVEHKEIAEHFCKRSYRCEYEEVTIHDENKTEKEN